MGLSEITDRRFAEEASGILVLLFTSPWCTACHKVEVSLEKLAESFVTIRFGKLDVVANPGTPATLGVLGLPTIILFKGGQETGRLIGEVSEKAINRELKKLAC